LFSDACAGVNKEEEVIRFQASFGASIQALSDGLGADSWIHSHAIGPTELSGVKRHRFLSQG